MTRVDDLSRCFFGCLGVAQSGCFRAGVAQLVEHLICNQRVGGSSPFASSRVQSPRHVRPCERQCDRKFHPRRSPFFPGDVLAGCTWIQVKGLAPGHVVWAVDLGWVVKSLSCAQVAERLMAADCKSAAPRSYAGSNPALCTSFCSPGVLLDCCNEEDSNRHRIAGFAGSRSLEDDGSGASPGNCFAASRWICGAYSARRV